MNRFYYIICVALLAACSTGQVDAEIPNFPFSLKLDKSAVIQEIKRTGKPYDSYSDGLRVIIKSLNNEEFMKSLQTNEREKYFEIFIYNPEPLINDVQTWIHENCSDALIARKIIKDDFTLYDLDKCRMTYYILTHKNVMYRFWEGDDSSDHERVWEILKNAKFAD